MTSAFDVTSYLDSRNISYLTSGKNVSRGWIEISCPVPLCPDKSAHCGINLSSKNFNCWVCGTKGSPTKLVQMIENCSWSEAKTIVDEFTDWTMPVVDFRSQTRTKINWPAEFKPINPENIPNLVEQYLTKRGFNSEAITKRYRLFYPFNLGYYKFRLIVPIFYQGRIVNFYGRDVTSKASIPWKSCPNEEAEITLNNVLYGIDDFPEGNPVILVEGIFDKWRLGSDSLATFGVSISDSQVAMLKEKNPEKVFILLDPGAETSAQKMASKIWFCPVEVCYLDGDKDPGELTPEEAKFLINELFRKP